MSPRHCGLFIINENDASQLRAPLTSINVNATTCGPIAQNVIKFRYRNTNDAAIESKFIFPMNSRTCIYHLSANVGGRQIVGKVIEKREAEKKYKEAVRAGNSAVLVKQAEESSDIIELELGAFGGNEEAEVIIKEIFEMKLTRKGTRFQYKFPTSLFVRYGDSITTTASQNLPNTEYVLNFKLTSHNGVSRIIPKPWLGVETSGQLFSFDGNRKVFEKDHDVILDLILSTNYKGFRLIETKNVKIHESFTSKIKNCIFKRKSEVRKIGKKIIFSSFLVNVPTTPLSELPAKEYVFVVDCSGSMSGDRIAQARKTLQQLINSLPVGSYFNIVRFGSAFEMLFGAPKEYNSTNKQIAMKLSETFGADLGGTELLDCLQSVVESERQIVQYKRQVFVLTDGGISNQEETLLLVKKYASTNRLFSFGIGSGCSTALVNGLADAGMGYASFITDPTPNTHQEEGEENLVSTCIKSLMVSASQHISNITVTPEPMSPKEPIKMIVDSTCLNVFHNGGLCDVTLELTLINNEEHTKVSRQDTSAFETRESPFEPNALRKLAATKILGELNNELRNSNPLYAHDSLRNRIIERSVKEQVLSPLTALVGVADDKVVTAISKRVDTGMPSSDLNCIGGSDPLLSRSCRYDELNESVHSTRRRTCSTRMNFGRSHRESILEKYDVHTDYDSPFYKAQRACFNNPAYPDVKKPLNEPVQRRQYDNNNAMTGKEDVIYQSITNKQQAGGEWTDKIQSKHDGDLFTKIEHSNIADKTVQFTLYAVLLLLIDFADSFDEWKISAVKGVMVLKKSIPNLESEIVDILSEFNLEADDEMLVELFG